MFKDNTVKQAKFNSQHKQSTYNSGIAIAMFFFRELFHHDNISYRCSTLIHARESPRKSRVHYLLLWSRLIAHVQGVVEGCSYVSCPIMFLEFLQGGMRVWQQTKTQHTWSKRRRCFLLGFPSCTMPFIGGVYCSFVLRTRVHVKSCSFSRRHLALSFL